MGKIQKLLDIVDQILRENFKESYIQMGLDQQAMCAKAITSDIISHKHHQNTKWASFVSIDKIVKEEAIKRGL